MFKKYAIVPLLFFFFLISGSVAADVNVALNKNATQSSTYNSSFPASKAVDGDTDTFQHTTSADGGYSWWEVDLGNSTSIHTLKLIPRYSDRKRFDDSWIMVAQTPFPKETSAAGLNNAKNHALWKQEIPSGNGSYEITLNQNARYVFIQRDHPPAPFSSSTDDQTLNIKEVEVWVSNNQPPTDITLSNKTVDENQPTNTLVGTFSATDPDTGDTFTYMLVNDIAYPGNNSFWIDDNKLKTNEVFDYETQSSYQINVQVKDSAGNTYEKLFNIQVNNVDEADLKISEITPPTPSPAHINEDVTFTVRVNNLGPDHANGTKTLTVTYDRSVSIVSATQTSGGGDFTCHSSGNTITCTKPNQLSSGAVNKDFEFVVQPLSGGTLTQTATITSDTTSDPDTANNTVTSQVAVDSSCHGCDCSLDDDALNTNPPGVTIPALDHAASDVSTCLSGMSDGAIDNNQTDYYNFTVNAAGEFTVRTDSPNNHPFHLRIEVNGSIVYPDQINQHHAFDINLSSGDQVILYFNETGNDFDEYEANLTFTIDTSTTNYPCSNPHKFTTRYNEYVPGDLVAIGNSNICADVDPNDLANRGDGVCDANQRRRNDTTNVIHINKWSSTNADISSISAAQAGNLLNVTNAELNLPPGAKVKWAGLYWQGSIWNFKRGIIINSHHVDSGDDGQKMMAKAREVSFKRPNDTSFMSVNADEHYWFNLYRAQLYGGIGKSWGYGYGQNFGYTDKHYFKYYKIKRYEQHYQGFKDVTSLLKEVEDQKGSANGKYWVGNIQATVGLLGYPGAEAAWTLQVIYDLPNAQPRVITVTDGYIGLYASATQGDDYARENNCPTGADNTGVYAYDVSFDINNILTPKKKTDFATDMTLFATESDPDSQCATDSLPEQLTLTKKDGSIYVVDGNPASLPGANPRNTCDAWHYSITKKDGSDNLDRNPNDIYPIGMTLRNYHMTDALSPDQNKTHITFKTDTDRLILGVIGFATDMNAPELCYDYDVRIGDYIKIPSTDRNFTAQKWGNKDLQVKVLIRSKEADYDFENAKLRLTFTPDDVFSYHTGASKISPEGINLYLPAVETDSTRGEIAIGHDFGSDGGILGPAESTYIKQKFAFLKDTFSGKFDIHVDGNVSYIPGQPPVGYHLSTAIDKNQPGHIGRCPTNPVYDPIWGSFNVENNVSSLSDPESERYPLYTQIAGRDYSVRVVSYKKSAATGKYDEPHTIHATVEMELIDVSPFDNNASAGYDSTCQEPVAASKGAFIRFDNEESITVTPTDSTAFPDYDKQLVLRNAAFRIWMLTRDAGNGTRALVDHNCSSSADSGCFDLLYANVYEHAEDNTTQYCTADCDNSTGTTCYDCLRTYFARPVCSRDNFSIRPEGFRAVIRDTNETNDSTVASELSRNVSGKQSSRLVAGYNYQLKVEATSYDNKGEFNDPGHRARAYYTRFKVPQTVNPLPANTLQRGKVILLDFNDSTACNDTNDSAMSLVMYDSITPSDQPTFVHSNVGHYGFRIVDGEWTRIDQGDYAFKPVFDPDCKTSPQPDKCFDCLLPGKTDPNKVECAIRSSIAGDPSYTDIALLFEPYRFDLSSIGFATKPANQKHLFMTDFDDDYYGTAASLSNPMAAYYSGTVIAKSKDGKITTNFSDGCAATDVTLQLHRETNASEDDLKTLFGIEFQQYLQYGSSLASQTSFDDKQLGKDANLTLAKSAFEDTVDPGSASIRVYTTFRKPAKDDILDGSEGINPIRINYREINATDPDANASAHLGTHIPTGTQPQDSNVTFLYAKVTPNDKLYTEPGDRVATPLNIIIYCDQGIDTCKEFDLNSSISMAHESSNWYLATNLFSNPSDLGSSDLNVSYYSGKTPGDAQLELNGTMTPAKTLTGVGYHLDGTQPDIIVSLPSSNPRPVTVEINYVSSPWLNYDSAQEYYRVRFIPQPTKWTGYGKTGHVVGDDISTSKTKRLEW